MSPSNNTPHAKAVRSVRLIFEYEGDRVHLVSQQPVEMAVTGFDLSQVDHPGYYVDTRDANDRTLTRVPARNAFVGSVEVFPERAGEPITRLDVPQPKGAFTVVVPAPETTDHVTVLQILPGKPEAPAPDGRATTDEPGRPEVINLVSFPLNLKH